MSSIETAPRTSETHESEPTLDARLDALSVDAGRHDLAVVAEDLRAQRVIQETFPPEKRAAASMEVRKKSKETTDKLRKLRIAAALATTLIAMSPQETAAKEQEPVTAEMLAENPERLEELLEGVLISIQEEQAKTDQPELMPLQEEGNSVLRTLQDGKERGGKYTKVAGQVAETAFKVLVSAAGFGVGVTVYDGLKKVAETLRAKSA